ncbi:MAG: ATP-binding cassette domain-containing protein [Actinomycetaceae bacterium]|nr:ATP-binding cassette domain-containing protein [Actinomycetaceae bacterium]
MIEVSNVKKVYSDQVTIGEVTVTFPQGGITALVGPNGAGKSTLLTMIGRLMRMDEGTIQVANFDVSSAKSADLAKVVSILRQENHFVSRLRVRDLVGFGRFPYSRGRLTQEDHDIVARSIGFLGLEPIAERFLDELSGGQRQRAYVAMILAQDTDYILLDEPLNNLDMAHAVQIMRHLRRIAAELGKTIVVVLHDLNFASCYADRICAMKDGKVFAFGRPREIMSSPMLTQIFDTEVEVMETERGLIATYY